MSKNLKLKKVIESFVPEPISSVFHICLNVFRIRMNMSILRIHILVDLVDPLYVTKILFILFIE